MPEGDEIVVIGARTYTANNLSQFEGSGSGSYFFSASSGAFSSSSGMAGAVLHGDFQVTEDAPPTVEGDEIVVTATKEQVDAAKIAYEAAGVNLGIAQILGVIAAGLVSKYAAIGLGVADKVLDLNSDAIQSAYADLLYAQDGADGTYDGYAQEMNGFDGYIPAYNGPGPKTPPMLDPNSKVGDSNYQQAYIQPENPAPVNFEASDNILMA